MAISRNLSDRELEKFRESVSGYTSVNIVGDSSDPVPVSVVGGGGTVVLNSEFAEDAAHTSGDMGLFALAVRHDADTSMVSADGDYAPLQVDADGALKVSGAFSISGVATEVTLAALEAKFGPLGQAVMAASAPVVIASDQSAIPVSDGGSSLTVDGTVAATQSGTWNITNVSGTISLPTGAATETTLASLAAEDFSTETTLSALNAKFGALGQALMAASAPVVIASNQSAIPITDNSGSLTVDGTVAATQSGTWNITNVSGTVSLPTGAATEATLSALAAEDFATQTTLAALNAKFGSLGQTTMTGSAPVVIASDQSAIPITDNSGSLTVDGTVAATQSGTWNVTNVSGTVSLPTGAATSANQSTQITSLQIIDDLPLAQGSTTSGQSGVLAQAAVTSGTPSYTTATTRPLSMTTGGSLRTTVTGTTTVVGNVNTGSEFKEDNPHADGYQNTGNLILGVRNDSLAATLTASDDNFSVIATTSKGALYSRITDNTNFMPTMDAVGRAGFQKITDGTNTMPTMDTGARSGFVKLYDGLGFYNVPATVISISGVGIVGTVATDAFLNFQRFGSDGATYVRNVATANTLATARYATCDASGNTAVTPVDGYKATYSAAATAFAPAASATDVFTITGSASKTIRVTKIEMSATQTTAGNNEVLLVKRSTANSGGTSATPTIVPHDSSSAAGTAVVRSYTANPTTGTLVGAVASVKMFVSTTATENQKQIWDFGIRPSQAIVLRGTSQVLAINLNAATWTGGSISVYLEFTEE